MYRPILFRSEMVRAILAGRKTQTRRIINPQPLPWATRFEPAPLVGTNFVYGKDGNDWVQMSQDGLSLRGLGRCRYGVPFDRLWVKETFQFYHCSDGDPYLGPIPKKPVEGAGISYKADYPDFEGWRPSIFMPRWASRITLDVVNVRVERLQDISFEDCLAEGVDDIHYSGYDFGLVDVFPHSYAKMNYRRLWDSINGKKTGFSWADNPWLWVIEFRMVKNA